MGSCDNVSTTRMGCYENVSMLHKELMMHKKSSTNDNILLSYIEEGYITNICKC